MIVQLKANQKLLLQQIEIRCPQTSPVSTCKTVCQGKRNRHETRITTVFDAGAIVTIPAWRDVAMAIIQVERIVQSFHAATASWKRSSEISYYLSSRTIDAKHAVEATRCHWHIENRSHHVRDVTLGEDASRIRTNPGVFARLRSFAANILRFNQVGTIRQDRYATALGGYHALTKLRFS